MNNCEFIDSIQIKPKIVRNRDGRICAVICPAEYHGYGHISNVLFWRIDLARWENKLPWIEVVFCATGKVELERTEFELPSQEGYLLLESEIQFAKLRRSSLNSGDLVLNKLNDNSEKLSNISFEEAEENPSLSDIMIADGLFGYGYSGNRVFWRLTDQAWTNNQPYIARIMFSPLKTPSKNGKPNWDKTIRIMGQEGSFALEREVAFVMVLSQKADTFWEG
jgi:hypothetical protein